MWTPWAWALAAILLAAGGAAVTALRSSLLIVGEEGLAGGAPGRRVGLSLPVSPLLSGEPFDARGDDPSPPNPPVGREGWSPRSAVGGPARQGSGSPGTAPGRSGR